MKTIRLLNTPYLLSLTILTAICVVGCGTFQGTSYYASDGIYAEAIEKRVENPEQYSTNNSSYYSEYFQELSDEYGISTNQSSEDQYFTDTDSYSTDTNVSQSNISNKQTPWGGNTSQLEINIYNNRPTGFWGFYDYGAFGFSPYYDYYYNPFFMTYAPFYNPYRFNRFGWGWNRFYSPFYYDAYYGYNPYYNPYHNNFYHNNAWNPRYSYAGRSNFSRIRGKRGERSYASTRGGNLNSKSIRQSKNKEDKDVDVKTRTSILNVGRGVYVSGRNGTISAEQREGLGLLNSGGTGSGSTGVGITSSGDGSPVRGTTTQSGIRGVNANTNGSLIRNSSNVRTRPQVKGASANNTSPRNNPRAVAGDRNTKIRYGSNGEYKTTPRNTRTVRQGNSRGTVNKQNSRVQTRRSNSSANPNPVKYSNRFGKNSSNSGSYKNRSNTTRSYNNQSRPRSYSRPSSSSYGRSSSGGRSFSSGSSSRGGSSSSTGGGRRNN